MNLIALGLATMLIGAIALTGMIAGMVGTTGPQSARNERIMNNTPDPGDIESAAQDHQKLNQALKIGVATGSVIGEGGPLGPGGPASENPFAGPASDATQIVKNFVDDTIGGVATDQKPSWMPQSTWQAITVSPPPPSATNPTVVPLAPTTMSTIMAAPPTAGCGTSNDTTTIDLTGTGTSEGGFGVTVDISPTSPAQPTTTTTAPPTSGCSPTSSCKPGM